MSDEAGCAPRPKGHISKAAYPSIECGRLEGHDGGVMAVRFSATGAYALTAGRDKTVKLWNPYTGLCIKTYKGHGREVNDAAGSKDNSRLVSGGADRSVFLWDVSTGMTLNRFRGHTSAVNAVMFAAESTVVVSGSYDKTVMCWDLRSNSHEPIQTLDEATDSVTSIDVGGPAILTGSVDGHSRLYDIRMGKLREDFAKDPVTSVSFSHDHNCLLISTLNSTVRLLDRDTGESLAEYKGHTNAEFKLDSVLSHNDAYVVSGSEDGDLCYWALVEGRMVHRERKAHSAVVASASYHPSKPALLTASVDGQVSLWQCEKPKS